MRSRDFQERLDAAREEGWSVVEDGDRRVVLKRSSFGSRLGHLLVGAATVWWSFGIGNIAYALYEYVEHTEYRVLYAKENDEDPMETLRRRYARGEIDERELERRAERIAESEAVGSSNAESEVSEDPTAESKEGSIGSRLRDRVRDRF